MSKQTDTGLILLHTDRDGLVWVGDDFYWSECSNYKPPELLANINKVLGYSLSYVKSVRIPSIKRNAYLVKAFCEYNMRKTNKSEQIKVFVVNPRIIYSIESQPPYRVLGAVKQLPTVWETYLVCPVTVDSYIGYAVTEAASKNDNEAWMAWLRKHHPVASVLDYVWWGDPYSSMGVLAEIMDIRWFVHSHKPGSISRLKKFFCFGETIRRSRKGKSLPRRWQILSDWVWPRSAEEMLKKSPSEFPEFVRLAMKNPWPYNVIKLASKILHLLYRIWLEKVTFVHPEAAFDPDLFFRNEPSEAERYKKLVKK